MLEVVGPGRGDRAAIAPPSPPPSPSTWCLELFRGGESDTKGGGEGGPSVSSVSFPPSLPSIAMAATGNGGVALILERGREDVATTAGAGGGEEEEEEPAEEEPAEAAELLS